jgi:branched-chain amino acid transport system permease protein
MFAYVLAGLVMGGIYSISAASMVVTYVSAGVLNFAFGSIAFFIARLYYYLDVQLNWGIVPSAIVSIVIVAPLLGVALYLSLFKYLSRATALTKVVATIGLSVAIPAVAELIFGTSPILSTPGLAPQPEHIFHVLGVAVTADQLICYICVVAVLGIGWYLLQRSRIGLLVRATVDSEALTSVSGVAPGRVALGVWAGGTMLAGLAGVLAGPILSVDSVSNYTLLTASAFAAVVAARLRSLPIAVIVALAMGIAGSLAQWALPPQSPWTTNVVSSIPFGIVVIFLLWYTARGSMGKPSGTGGALDEAIRVDQSAAAAARGPAPGRLVALGGRPRLTPGRLLTLLPNNTFLVVAAILPLVLTGYRIGLVAEAAAYAIIFLSYTLLTGQGGMISLCQITFAGVGAITAAQMSTVYGWPVLAGVALGAVLAGIGGLIVGALTVRMGNLYVALATLTFGLLMSTLVFEQNRFYQVGAGVNVPTPDFLQGGRALAYFTLAVFVIIGLALAATRHSTPGLALSALRSTETGARAVGVNVFRVKIGVSAVAAAIAGLGGGLLAIYSGAAIPDSFDALTGLIWFSVLVTNGIRTNNAALAAGLIFVYLPDVLSTYLPVQLGPVSTALFGLGAVMLARNPEGVISMNGRQLASLGRKLGQFVSRRPEAAVNEGTAPVVESAKV